MIGLEGAAEDETQCVLFLSARRMNRSGRGLELRNNAISRPVKSPPLSPHPACSMQLSSGLYTAPEGCL
jgi:hypothetical protein